MGGAEELVFRLGAESYAVGVHAVEEVVDAMPITLVSRSPAFLLGIINLRGRIIPVMDLRLRLGMEPKEHDIDSCFMVVQLRLGDRQLPIAVVLDAVEGVVDLAPEQIDRQTSIGRHSAEVVLSGLARDGDRILLIVEPDQLLTEELLDRAFSTV